MTEHEQLVERFRALGIDPTTPGFLRDQAFLAAAAHDPFLPEAYARLVLSRASSPAECVRARRLVLQTARLVHARLLEDGRLGHCLPTAQVISRLLDAQGVWNVVVNGALGITLPYTRLSLPAIADLQGRTVTGHAWVVAPPFLVVDVSVQRQPWDDHLTLLPQVVLSEHLEPAHVYADTLLRAEAHAALEAALGRSPTVADVQARVPWLTKALRRLPTGAVLFGEVRLDYVPLTVPSELEAGHLTLAGQPWQALSQQLAG